MSRLTQSGHRLEAWITTEVRDPSGRVIRRRRFPSRSYVIAMADLLYVQSQTEANGSIVDINGTTQTITNNAYAFRWGLVVTATRGIVVGTGTVAVALADYALGTKIGDGAGAGQLVHGSPEITAGPITSGTTRRFSFARVFTNNSGGSITVTECGIYAWCSSEPRTVMLCRDIVPGGGDAVGSGNTYTVTYTIGVTV